MFTNIVLSWWRLLCLFVTAHHFQFILPRGKVLSGTHVDKLNHSALNVLKRDVVSPQVFCGLIQWRLHGTCPLLVSGSASPGPGGQEQTCIQKDVNGLEGTPSVCSSSGVRAAWHCGATEYRTQRRLCRYQRSEIHSQTQPAPGRFWESRTGNGCRGREDCGGSPCERNHQCAPWYSTDVKAARKRVSER